jgi:hypothetical protein
MRIVAAILALFLGVVPATAGGVDIGVPASSLDVPDGFWDLFMKRQYGPFDTQKKCWVGHSKGESYCMKPNTLERVKIGGKPMVFLTANGGVVTEPDKDNACHACSGNIGYFVLDASGSSLLLTAKGDPYLESGSYGQAPGKDAVKVRQIGPHETYGWTEERSDMGQGINMTIMVVKAVVGDQVRSLGGVLTSFDDNESCENNVNLTTGKACTNVTFEATFDTAAKGRFSPLVLRSSGDYEGETFNRTFTAKFDKKTFLYVEPKDLPKGLREP